MCQIERGKTSAKEPNFEKKGCDSEEEIGNTYCFFENRVFESRTYERGGKGGRAQ